MQQEDQTITIGFIGSNEMLAAFEKRAMNSHTAFMCADTPGEWAPELRCDLYIDCFFKPERARMQSLLALRAPVLINCVDHTAASLQEIAGYPGHTDGTWSLNRFNGWPTFFERPLLELALPTPACDEMLRKLQWPFETTPDQPGLFSARVISMIINEAFFALGEEVSTREEIDTAMKLGTNYPYGPFEWARLIGEEKIAQLLETLSHIHDRYKPAPLLKGAAATWP